jgi:hypothetical protein
MQINEVISKLKPNHVDDGFLEAMSMSLYVKIFYRQKRLYCVLFNEIISNIKIDESYKLLLKTHKILSSTILPVVIFIFENIRIEMHCDHLRVDDFKNEVCLLYEEFHYSYDVASYRQVARIRSEFRRVLLLSGYTIVDESAIAR